MSHKATNWAIQQRGLMPATKLVLWHLCDRHNPDFGCFPSQDQLAADVEISRSSLNTHLEKLEAAGLIRRHRRVDEVTRKQKSTRYILGFEDDFGREPCPDSGHGNGQKPCPDFGKSRVQNLDTNLVREPVTTTAREADAVDDAEASCLAACGEGLNPASRTAITATRQVIADWLAKGFDLTADILPTLAERTKRKRTDPIRTWEYFTPAIAARHTRRLAQATKAKDAGEKKPAARASRAEILAFTADWINSDRYVPTSAVSNVMRDDLLAAGLVTVAALRAKQIY
jgi:DNA-binding transcriptional ArsR family regulator